ncbi:MAG: WG repeat-containing protein [Thermoleophilia bacterium]|nr:WG repeat-containing protein [Thermoleophilia bacterium]
MGVHRQDRHHQGRAAVRGGRRVLRGSGKSGVAEDGGITWGYIDTSGSVAIEPRFTYAEDFSEGLAVVGEIDSDGNPSACGYIDTSSTLVIPMEYDGAGAFRDGLAQVHDADGSHFIDKTGTVVAGPYRLAFGFSEGLAYADDGSRRGFIDTNGNWAAVLESAAIDMSSYLSSLSYFPGSAQGFSEGLVALQATSGGSPPRMGTADKGYVDKTGAWVIEPRFNYACDFSEGLAAVAVRGNEFSGLKWGFIDKTGAWVIEPRFECAERFADGMAVVGATVGDYMSFGYIDKTGTVVIPIQYWQAGDFSGGIAQIVSQSDSYSGSLSYIDTSGTVVWPSGSGATNQPVTTTSAVETGDEPSGLYPVSVDGKWGFIDKNGAIVIEPQFDIISLPRPDYISDGFSDGLAMVGAGEANEEKWGYIDKTGVWVVQPEFEFVHQFSDGMAMVAYHTRDLPRIGFVDTTGALVIPIQYGLLTEGFSEGLCLVSLDGEANGYIDKTGAVVIDSDPAYGYVADFHEGLAAVQKVDDPAAFGYIDTNGAWVMGVPSGLAPGSQGGFSEGLAVVYNLESVVSEDRCGFIDRTGAVVIEPQFSWALEFSEGLAAVAVGENEAEKWGFIDQTGAWVIEPQFSSALEFSEGLAAVAVGENEAQRWGFVDRTGAWVIEPQYESACSFTGGIAFVGDSWWPTYIDKTGKVIWQGE